MLKRFCELLKESGRENDSLMLLRCDKEGKKDFLNSWLLNYGIAYLSNDDRKELEYYQRVFYALASKIENSSNVKFNKSKMNFYDNSNYLDISLDGFYLDTNVPSSLFFSQCSCLELMRQSLEYMVSKLKTGTLDKDCSDRDKEMIRCIASYFEQYLNYKNEMENVYGKR